MSDLLSLFEHISVFLYLYCSSVAHAHDACSCGRHQLIEENSLFRSRNQSIFNRSVRVTIVHLQKHLDWSSEFRSCSSLIFNQLILMSNQVEESSRFDLARIFIHFHLIGFVFQARSVRSMIDTWTFVYFEWYVITIENRYQNVLKLKSNLIRTIHFSLFLPYSEDIRIELCSTKNSEIISKEKRKTFPSMTVGDRVYDHHLW